LDCGGGSSSSSNLKKINDNQVSCFYSQSVSEQPLSDGITVKGDEINQKFGYTNIGCLESEVNVIVLKLKGYNSENKKIKKLITTREKIVCKTCGKSNSPNHKFCSECGTFLE